VKAYKNYGEGSIRLDCNGKGSNRVVIFYKKEHRFSMTFPTEAQATAVYNALNREVAEALFIKDYIQTLLIRLSIGVAADLKHKNKTMEELKK